MSNLSNRQLKNLSRMKAVNMRVKHQFQADVSNSEIPFSPCDICVLRRGSSSRPFRARHFCISQSYLERKYSLLYAVQFFMETASLIIENVAHFIQEPKASLNYQ